MKNNIQYLKEEAKIYERGILTLLLEISRSFSDKNYTKQKRDEIFVKIDGLRDKVKDINKVIKELQKSEEDIQEYGYINKRQYAVDNLIKMEEKSEEKDALKTNLEEGKKEILEENIENNLIHVIDNIKELEKNQTKDISNNGAENKKKPNEKEIENDNIRRRNRERRNRNYDDLNNNENKSVQDKNKEIVNENNSVVENVENINLIQNIEEIDRLIEEAQKLNDNIIKFPESRRKRIENNEDTTLYTLKEENEAKYEKTDIDNDTVEPVPVLFGNSRAQNQMIVRKKSNGFSDKLKSLIFKIKTLLGGEDEE